MLSEQRKSVINRLGDPILERSWFQLGPAEGWWASTGFLRRSLPAHCAITVDGDRQIVGALELRPNDGWRVNDRQVGDRDSRSAVLMPRCVPRLSRYRFTTCPYCSDDR
jgi:hypothetical protein